MTDNPLIVPTTTLGGTHPTALLNAIQDARDALAEALRALADVAPNGRDYPMGNFAAAVEQYQRWRTPVEELGVQLYALEEAIVTQVDERRRRAGGAS